MPRRSDGHEGLGFAARMASYWLASSPHPMRICDAAPCPFERMVLASGSLRTYAAGTERSAFAAECLGGTRKRDVVRVERPGVYTIIENASSRQREPSPL